MPIINSLQYILSAIVMLGVFATIYCLMTPFRELQLIRQGVVAAGISFGGAIIGLSLPLVSAIFFTHDFAEMLKWGTIGCSVQLILVATLWTQIHGIEKGNVAAGLLSAGSSIACGLIVAASIS